MSEVSGNGTVGSDGRVSGTLTVAAASIDTENTRTAGRGVAVTGALTVRGRTRPLSFDAAVSVDGVAGTHGTGSGAEIWLDAEVHRPRRVHPALSAARVTGRQPAPQLR